MLSIYDVLLPVLKIVSGDLGLVEAMRYLAPLRLYHERCPRLEDHASTQLRVHGQRLRHLQA